MFYDLKFHSIRQENKNVVNNNNISGQKLMPHSQFLFK